MKKFFYDQQLSLNCNFLAASSYVIRYSYHNSSILTKSFSSGILVSADQLLFGDLNSPSVANTIENFIVNLTDIPKNKDLVTLANY